MIAVEQIEKNMSKYQRIAVLMGGLSAEHSVSMSSGKAVLDAVKRLGYEAIAVEVDQNIAQVLAQIQPDFVFNALHGRWGEDGSIQGILDYLGVPYSHSGVLASALAMDKEKTKILYRAAGLPVAKSVLAKREDIEKAHILPPPYVVKPFDEGSSVGVYIVNEGDNPPQIAPNLPEILMVEAFIPGRELTVTVMGERALAVTEIRTKGWYDFEAKYSLGGSEHILPAPIDKDIENLCLDYALRAHQALGLKGLSRTDFRYDESLGSEGLFLLETNNQPGMTDTSLAPEQAGFCGISFDELIKWMIEVV